MVKTGHATDLFTATERQTETLFRPRDKNRLARNEKQDTVR